MGRGRVARGIPELRRADGGRPTSGGTWFRNTPPYEEVYPWMGRKRKEATIEKTKRRLLDASRRKGPMRLVGAGNLPH